MLCLVHLRKHAYKVLPDEGSSLKTRENVLNILCDYISRQNSNINVKYFHKNNNVCFIFLQKELFIDFGLLAWT